MQFYYDGRRQLQPLVRQQRRRFSRIQADETEPGGLEPPRAQVSVTHPERAAADTRADSQCLER